MHVKVFPIPAKQALAQKVDAIDEGHIIGMNTNGTAVLVLEDHTLVCIPVDQLQRQEEVRPFDEPETDEQSPVDPPKPDKVKTPLAAVKPSASKPGKA